MFRMTTRSIFPRVSAALAVLVLFLSACTVTVITPTPAATQVSPTEAPASTAAAVQPTATAATGEAAATLAPGESAPAVTVDASGVAQGAAAEVIAAKAPGAAEQALQVMPQYTLLTLEGYPATTNPFKPQVFAFPVKGLVINEQAARQAVDLQTLLQSQQISDQLPYLPLVFSARQALHPQVKYLDFKNGKGVRFLTEWHNGLAAINNQDLLYTFQGLTSDGKYYVSAVLPVNLKGLPADSLDTSGLPADFQANYTQYLADTANLLDQAPPGDFTPDLSKLDAMMQSIEVK